MNPIQIPNMKVPERSAKSVRSHFDKVCLLDADFLKYYVTGDIEKEIKQGHDMLGKYGPNYLDVFVQRRVDELVFKRFSCWGVLFCFSAPSSNTFRYGCAFEKEYKGNRSVTVDVPYERYHMDMAGVVGSVGKKYAVLIKEDLEADDVVSFLQNEHTFIYSEDKDLKQVPGHHYDWGRNALTEISEEDAVDMLAMQLLTGDTSDNIPGLKGIGKITAEKILEGVAVERKFARVVKEYIKNYGTVNGIDIFCEMWQLLKTRGHRGDWLKSRLSDMTAKRDLIINTNINGK